MTDGGPIRHKSSSDVTASELGKSDIFSGNANDLKAQNNTSEYAKSIPGNSGSVISP